MTLPGQLNRHFDRMLGTAAAAGQSLSLAVVIALGIVGAAGARAEDTLNIATWGGAYGQSQEIAYFEPFAKETGTRIATEIYDGTLAKIKEMIGGDESAIDVVDVSAATLGALCSDGLLETIEASSLGAAPTGESAELDFYSGALSSCGVGSVAWSTAIVFDRQAFAKAQPSQIADLLDQQALPRQARAAERRALYARACAARRRRRPGQCLYRACDAGRRRSRFQGARQDQGRHLLVGQRARTDHLALRKEGRHGGRL